VVNNSYLFVRENNDIQLFNKQYSIKILIKYLTIFQKKLFKKYLLKKSNEPNNDFQKYINQY